MEHGHECHQRLARTHVALQQTVHLTPRAEVGTDLMHDTLLCAGKLKGQVVAVEIVEQRTNALKNIALVFLAPLRGIAQNVELDVEELFKLQPHLGTLHVVHRLRIVDLAQRLLASDEMKTAKLFGQQGFGDRTLRDTGDKCLGHLLQ